MIMMDMLKMFGKMKDLQKKTEEMKVIMQNTTATGESGAGMVKIVVNGQKKVQSMIIDPILMTEDKKMLEDLTVAAVNMAIKNVEEKIKVTLKNNYKDILNHLPIDLENLF